MQFGQRTRRAEFRAGCEPRCYVERERDRPAFTGWGIPRVKQTRPVLLFPLSIVLILFGCVTTTPTPVPTVTPAPARSAQDQNDMMQKLDRYLTRRTKNDEFSGVVLVAQNGSILLEKG